MSWEVICSESRAALATVPDACVDAVVCDPPAGIEFMGKEWDSPKTYSEGHEALFGREDGTNGGVSAARTANPRCKNCGGTKRRFLKDPNARCSCPSPDFGENEKILQDRRDFIAFLVPVFSECLRVMKPGAHGLVWALPRTSHWTATALEDAGFEVRDVLVHMFGTGFPKSLNVAKAIQKSNGVAPLAVEKATLGMASNPQWNDLNNRLVMPIPEGLAAEWDGFGTALKPAAEHWILARKPVIGTIVENVLAHGTGALNIDGCRIICEGGSPSVDRRLGMSPGKSGEEGFVNRTSEERYKEQRPGEETGRWPANVVLSHHESCVRVGSRKIKAITGTAAGRMAGNVVGTAYGDYAGSERAGERTGFGDANGNESVDVFACVPGCPVRDLDDMTSRKMHSAGTAREGNFGGDYGATSFNLGENGARPMGRFGDSGGAARFYYQAKPSRREKDLGCAEAGIPPKYRKNDTEKKDPYYNDHPTSKSVSLMRWLVRLVGGKPGSLILDPFCGGGTTGVAAVLEGFSFAGIDREQPFVDIARARIAYAETHREEFEK